MPSTVAVLLYATIMVMVVTGSHGHAAPALAAAPQDQEATEGQKRNAEIEKLKAETRKLDSEAMWWWVTPVLTLISFVGSAVFVAYQIRAASTDRDKTIRAASAERDKNAKNEATLKLAEFVIASRQPAMARERLNILERIDSDVFGGTGLAERIVRRENFPSIETREIQIEVLKLIAAQPDHGKKIVESFIHVFPDEKDWLNQLRSLFP